jgi:UDP-N-acetylmuramoyl-tripeptide--D-alanyl-D-alanine ligase
MTIDATASLARQVTTGGSLTRSIVMRWTPAEVAMASGGVLVIPARAEVVSAEPAGIAGGILTSVAIDSRVLSSGALFVALRAERDGHEWIDAAVEAGAGCLLVEEAWARSARPAELAVPFVAVADTREALMFIGRAARDRLDATVIGITGSVGKTSTKDLVAAALAVTRQTTASEKSFNNELGVPLTLANARVDTQAAVIEMGARGPGHIRHLCQIARPEIGVVTAVGVAHTELFGSLDAVAAAKGELVEALPPHGTAVLNDDDPRVRAMARRTSAGVLTYSAGGDGRRGADLVAERVVLDEQLRPGFVARSPWGSHIVRLQARGAHQVGNALAALAVAGRCGVPIEGAAAALASTDISPWRMQLDFTPAGAAILNDAYNANPASMVAALEALAALPARRRVAVLGVMAELGPRSPEEHRAIAALVDQLGFELLAVSTDAYGRQPVAGVDQAVAAIGPLGRGDAVLVKGSRVAGLEALAARLLAGA